MLLITLINVLLRTGRVFAAPHVSVPNVPVMVPAVGIAERKLSSAVQELAFKIDPHSRLSSGALDYGIQVVIGDTTVSGQRVIAPGVTACGAALRSLGFDMDKHPHPVAAVVAANAAVSEVYKTIVTGHHKLPILDTNIDLPRLAGKIDLGKTLWVGAGGIGHSLTWTMQWMKIQGSITILDLEFIEISNLNRYLCAFLGDLDGSKPGVLANILNHATKLSASAQNGKYEQLRDEAGLDVSLFDHVISTVDTGISRIEMQSDLPRSIFNAGTNAWSFEASRHNFMEDACLACLFPPRNGVDYQQRVPCDQRQQQEEQNPNDSYSFVTGLAGAYLAQQIATLPRQATKGLPNHYLGSALQIDGIIGSQRKKDPECVLFCGDESVCGHFRAKYGRPFDAKIA
jgi:molybdopterin/thiamine biosynthesis adenylyltransferase